MMTMSFDFATTAIASSLKRPYRALSYGCNSRSYFELRVHTYFCVLRMLYTLCDKAYKAADIAAFIYYVGISYIGRNKKLCESAYGVVEEVKLIQ